MFSEKDEVDLTAQVIMEAFDKNKDGQLSKKEFTNGLRGADPKSKVGKQVRVISMSIADTSVLNQRHKSSSFANLASLVAAHRDLWHKLEVQE